MPSGFRVSGLEIWPAKVYLPPPGVNMIVLKLMQSSGLQAPKPETLNRVLQCDDMRVDKNRSRSTIHPAYSGPNSADLQYSQHHFGNSQVDIPKAQGQRGLGFKRERLMLLAFLTTRANPKLFLVEPTARFDHMRALSGKACSSNI